MAEVSYCIQVFTGDNKGKTSAALGVVLRSIGAGYRVVIIAFDKGFSGEEHYMERRVLRSFDNVEFHVTGCERITPEGFRFGITDEDKEEARRGLNLAKELIERGKQQLLVLDEIVTSVDTGLIEEQNLLDLIELYNKDRKCELILTGRGATQAIMDRADLVTEMRKIKHYFDEGVKARKGFDY